MWRWSSRSSRRWCGRTAERVEHVPNRRIGCGRCARSGLLRAAGRLRWVKRRWRCRDSLCPARTWTEASEHVDAQAVLTRRACVEACRQVGENARPVSQLADELGVCWWTILNAVVEHGTPLVDDPDRIGPLHQLGIDETSFLAATGDHPTLYATGLIDLERHIVIDMVHGNSAADLGRWTSNAHLEWHAGIDVVAIDLAEAFRAGRSPGLAHARRVADPFHVVRVGNRCVDQVHRRVQNETLGRRGRKHDPLYRIRKLLLTGSDASTNAAPTGCCSAYASANPTMSCSAPGSPRNLCATSTSPTRQPTPPP